MNFLINDRSFFASNLVKTLILGNYLRSKSSKFDV